MATRSGDVPADALFFVLRAGILDVEELEKALYHNSGLFGLSGLTGDMRELLAEEAESSDRRARLAIELFCYRVKKYIGAYLAAMNGADAVVFAGGIGENSADIRSRIGKDLDWLGVTLDMEANARTVNGAEGRIDVPGSRVELWVIPTDEELLIARDTWRVVTGTPLA